jgi:hypothetical protein
MLLPRAMLVERDLPRAFHLAQLTPARAILGASAGASVCCVMLLPFSWLHIRSSLLEVVWVHICTALEASVALFEIDPSAVTTYPVPLFPFPWLCI